MSEAKYCGKLFYKYKSINPYTTRLLEHNELYFSHPDGFNDPFDCKVDLFHKGTRDKWMEFFRQQNTHTAEASNYIKDCLKKGDMKQKKDGFYMKSMSHLMREICFELVVLVRQKTVC
ncbi:hypothetical protein [Methanosarcina mazei]|uniref:Uncharacterized protein n=1 Tax=Methanosarcina mazei TaxID=2209 RepID=A0A6C0VI93_METMZ|nr:hypothetical protein [Methanosarcina mazei]QIB91002.1 hypothetical protein FQU78_07985 [Methanosarcina mazei]